jgi:hypothetical protein
MGNQETVRIDSVEISMIRIIFPTIDHTNITCAINILFHPRDFSESCDMHLRVTKRSNS